MEEIKIIIAPDGSLKYEVHGVKGQSCKDLTKLIDKLGDVVEDTKTHEYNQTNTLTNKNELGK